MVEEGVEVAAKEGPVRQDRMGPHSLHQTGALDTRITPPRGAVEPTGNGVQVHTIAVIELCAPGGIGSYLVRCNNRNRNLKPNRNRNAKINRTDRLAGSGMTKEKKMARKMII